MSIRLIVFLLFGLLCSNSEAQQQQKFLIRTGKIFDSESGQFKQGLSIVVVNAKIEGVKAEKDLTAEEKNYSLIDLSNYAVLPGLID